MIPLLLLLVAAPDDLPIRTIRLHTGLSHADAVRATVNSVAFSPDGKSLASASHRMVKLWSPETGKELRTIREDGWITDVLFQDGKTLVTAGGRVRPVDEGGKPTFRSQGLIRFRAVESGKVLRTWTAAPVLSCLALSPDGSMLAAGCSERSEPSAGYDPEKPTLVLVWSVASGEVVRSILGEFPGVTDIAFSADGKHLAAATHNGGAVKVWAVGSGKLLRTFKEDEGGVACVGYSPDGKLLAAGSRDGTVDVWPAESGAARRTMAWPHDAKLKVPIKSIAFSSDSKIIAAASAATPWDADRVALWSVATGERLQHRFPGRRESNNSLSFSPDSKLVAAGNSEGEVKVWTVKDGTPDPWDVPGHRGRVLSTALSPDGKLLASSASDGTVRLWSVETGRELENISVPGGAPLRGLAFSPGSRILAGIDGEDPPPPESVPSIRLLSVESGEEVHSLTAGKGAATIAFSPDGRTLAAASREREGMLRVWDLEKGDLVKEFRTHGGGVLSLAFRPDSKQLATGAPGPSVRLWSLGSLDKDLTSALRAHMEASAPEMQILGSECRGVWDLAFSLDGSTVAAVALRRVLLASAASGEILQELKGHRHWVTSVAYNAEGSLLGSGDLEGRVILWDVVSGRPRHTWQLPGALRVLGFAVGGKALVTANGDGSASVLEFPAEDQEPIQLSDPAPPLPEGAKPFVERGRLRVSVFTDGPPLEQTLRMSQDGSRGFLLAAGLTLFHVDRHGKAEVVLRCQAQTPARWLVAAVRDPETGDVIAIDAASDVRAVWRISRKGLVQPLTEDERLDGLEHIIPDPYRGGWVLTNRGEDQGVYRVTRKGGLVRLVTSPLLEDVRAVTWDRVSRDLVVSASDNLYRLEDRGQLIPIIKPNQPNPLSLPNGLAQDPVSRDFFVISENTRTVCRVTRQGDVLRVTSLGALVYSLMRSTGNRDLLVNGFDGIVLALSGFAAASRGEIADWLGAGSAGVLPR